MAEPLVHDGDGATLAQSLPHIGCGAGEASQEKMDSRFRGNDGKNRAN